MDPRRSRRNPRCRSRDRRASEAPDGPAPGDDLDDPARAGAHCRAFRGSQRAEPRVHRSTGGSPWVRDRPRRGEDGCQERSHHRHLAPDAWGRTALVNPGRRARGGFPGCRARKRRPHAGLCEADRGSACAASAIDPQAYIFRLPAGRRRADRGPCRDPPDHRRAGPGIRRRLGAAGIGRMDAWNARPRR